MLRFLFRFLNRCIVVVLLFYWMGIKLLTLLTTPTAYGKNNMCTVVHAFFGDGVIWQVGCTSGVQATHGRLTNILPAQPVHSEMCLLLCVLFCFFGKCGNVSKLCSGSRPLQVSELPNI